MFALQDLKAHANGARQNDIGGNSIGENHRHNGWQPAVDEVEDEDDQPNAQDA
jgi:hypothetical protein